LLNVGLAARRAYSHARSAWRQGAGTKWQYAKPQILRPIGFICKSSKKVWKMPLYVLIPFSLPASLSTKCLSGSLPLRRLLRHRSLALFSFRVCDISLFVQFSSVSSVFGLIFSAAALGAERADFDWMLFHRERKGFSSR